MNNIYVLDAQNYETLFGTNDNPIQRSDLFIIAQKPDCSQFLVLSFQSYPGLDVVTSIPAGFDFTYCQEWGLTVNEEVIQRVWSDIRAKAYGPMSQQLDKIFHDGIESWKADIEAVKLKYPKL